MPTTIDELVVEVGLDPQKFAAGRASLDEQLNRARQSVESFGKGVERQGEKISEVFSVMKRGAAGILGAFIGNEAAQFIEHVATMDANTSRLARSIGESTRELSIWQNMVRHVGGDAQDASQTFGSLNDALMSFATGTAMPSPQLAQLMNFSGVKFTDKPDAALMKIMEFVSTQPAQMQRFWLQQVPGMNQGMMFLMMDGLKNMQHFREQVEKIGVASDDSAKKAKDLQDKTADLHTALDDLAREGFPVLTRIINGLTAALAAVIGKDPMAVAAQATGAGTVNKWLQSIPGIGHFFAPTGEAAIGSAAASTGGGATRGDRNNNPGNIRMGPWAAAHGASQADSGGFAIFPTWDAGANAMGALLAAQYQGLTLAQIQEKWVGNKDTGYLSQMMSSTGLGAGDVPDLSRGDVMSKLIRGMMRGEGTHVGGAGAGNSVTIGSINVQSNKADPKAVAEQIPDAMKRYNLLSGTSVGLQ